MNWKKNNKETKEIVTSLRARDFAKKFPLLFSFFLFKVPVFRKCCKPQFRLFFFYRIGSFRQKTKLNKLNFNIIFYYDPFHPIYLFRPIFESSFRPLWIFLSNTCFFLRLSPKIFYLNVLIHCKPFMFDFVSPFPPFSFIFPIFFLLSTSSTWSLLFSPFFWRFLN